MCVAERDEAGSRPVAGAVSRLAFAGLTEEQRRLVDEAKVVKLVSEASNGVSCAIRLRPGEDCDTVHPGNEAFLRQNHVSMGPYRMSCYEQDRDSTLAHIVAGNEYLGRLRLRDTVRTDGDAVISHLQHARSLQISMLTGDVESEAQRVATMFQIQVLSSHALPAMKQAIVQHLREQGSHTCVAMMGDGLNDAPALAVADVGIVLDAGSRVVDATYAQTADVVSTSPELGRFPELLEIADKTTRQASWNLWWAIVYNIIAASLANGVAEPIGPTVDAVRAGTLMASSSTSVLAWSMWLRHGLSKVSFGGIQVKAQVESRLS